MSLEYNEKNITLAQNLRKNATPQENHLWYDFLSKYEIRFQRQKAIDNFIADFYCHKAKLIIEIDGSQHYTEKGRKGECFDVVREKIEKGSLYEAILAECDNTLIYNLKKDKLLICTQTVQTRNWIIKMLATNK